MSKNKFICKLLGLVTIMGIVAASGLFYQNAFALSTEEIFDEVTREYGTTIRIIDKKHNGATFNDYTRLNSVRENQEFKNFVRVHCKTPEMIDSVLFLSLLNRIYEFSLEICNKQFDILEESLFRRMVSLRSSEEFRNDKFIVPDFDEYFSSQIKVVLKQSLTQPRYYLKSHRRTYSKAGRELPPTL